MPFVSFLGPLTFAAMVAGLLTMGGLLLKAHDAKVVNACNAEWESRIRNEEKEAARHAIETAQAQAALAERTTEIVTHDLEEVRAKLAALPADTSADPRCVDAGMYDRLFTGRAGAKRPAGGPANARPAS